MDYNVIIAIVATAAIAAVGYSLLYRRYRRTIGKVITTANRILKIDEDNIMLVGTAQVQVVHKQGDTPEAA